VGVFPVIFDATPSYLGGSSSRSLLLAPVGSGSLLCHLHSRLTSEGPYKLTVMPAFEPDSTYRTALSRTCGELERIVATTDFADFVASLEPSDLLLMIDPRHVMEEGLQPSLLLNRAREAPGTVIHLTALDANVGGTSEWVDIDAHGQISRVQRYYDDLTWSYAVGVAASLVPVWCLKTMRRERCTSLLSLRSALSAAGIPCRDVPLTGRAFDLSHEREFLMLTESIVRGMDPESAASSRVASAGQIDQSARIVGSVVVQSGARIERNATVIGPAVIGAGAIVGSGALVVQSVVNKEVRIPSGSVVRHRLVSDATHDTPIAQDPPAYDPLAVRGFRSEMRQEKPAARIYASVKLLVESTLATLALIVLSPLLAAVAILIKLESKGPVLFIDRREARGQKTFGCFKFRTMRTGADLLQRQLREQNDVDGPQFKLEKDPRLTRIGRWIRPCSIDELPQLINVMLGQMSLVGPRPSPFRENQTCVPWRDGRLSVRPGITGLWQVCRHNRGDGDFHQWIHYDLLYVQHMSPLVDLKIVLATILTLGGKSCVPLKWIIPTKSRLEA
jgi:lipopolysaccharide/colanic/teichoic acid biosynthesis glycosyltransferase/carbonic anhydrase/acetyltransferase-like protein (isoleucine patch superfamily)